MAKQRSSVSGLSDLTKTLESLSDDLRNKDMAYATRSGAKRFQDAARAYAPVESGKLRRNIVVRKEKDTLFDSEYLVGVRAVGKKDNPNNAFYAYFVEYGTANMAAHPFMRPAFDTGRGFALSEFKDRITRRVMMRRKQIAKGKITGAGK